MYTLLTLLFAVIPASAQPVSKLFALTLQATEPPFAKVLEKVAAGLVPLTTALLTVGIILSALGTVAAPMMPKQAQANTGWFLKAGVAAILVGMAPQIAAWITGLSA